MSDGRLDIVFVSEDKQLEMEQMARRVESDLLKVGLAVNWQGNSARGNLPRSPGVRVFYDPIVGAPAGVYVKWRFTTSLLEAAMTAGPESRLVHTAGAWLDVMTGTLERLLTAAGWEVDSVNVGVHESSIRIMRAPSNPFDIINDY
jgi:hypothetical protein